MTQKEVAAKFEKVAASRCACCGREITEGYDVPFVGAVGPVCVKKFAEFGQLLEWVEGRNQGNTDRADYPRLHRTVIGLRQIGIEVEMRDGEFHVGRRTRKAVEVAKSWKKRRAEFIRDLQIADGKNGVVEVAA